MPEITMKDGLPLTLTQARILGDAAKAAWQAIQVLSPTAKDEVRVRMRSTNPFSWALLEEAAQLADQLPEDV